MKIIALQSENVKRLRVVHIKPDGAMVVIRGENGAGKSSVLDSIMYALSGAASMPPEVIRRGEERAEVKIDLGDLIVTRHWTASGSSLRVENPEGARYPSPQTILDKLVGKLSFDPLAFTREKPKDQAETLKKLAGLDFTLNDRARERLYSERTLVNREIAALKAVAPVVSVAHIEPVEVPDEEVSIKDLLAEQTRRLAQEQANRDLRQKQQVARVLVSEDEHAFAQAVNEIARLEDALTKARADAVSVKEALAKSREALAVATADVNSATHPDLDAIRQQIAEAEQINARVRAKKARAAEAAKLTEKLEEEKKLTGQIGLLDLQKANAVADAHLPVANLGFNDEGVTLNGLPLVQASSAEQLRVSLAVGIALNPKLKVLLIRDGSLLDENSMRLVAEMAEAAGAQVWVEVVGKNGGVPGVVIEDGAVEGAPAIAEVSA